MGKRIICAIAAMTVCVLTAISLVACGKNPNSERASGYEGEFSVRLLLEPTESSPNVSKLITKFENTIAAEGVDKDLFNVQIGVKRVSVSSAYVCGETGEKSTVPDKYIALEVSNAPTLLGMQTSGMTDWESSYNVKLELAEGKTVKIGDTVYSDLSVKYNAVNDWFCPQTDVYEKDNFTHNGVTLQRALYTPEQAKNDDGKNPLIVWLHGLGEGGTDINIPLLKDNTVALSSDTIQSYFTDETQKGAYVAVIQCPTFWLDSTGNSVHDEILNAYTGVAQESCYTQALAAAIDKYISDNEDIDADRIYIAGCSNGGYMAVNLALNYGDKFAAYVPICAAYMSGNLSDDAINTLKYNNIWFVQSDDDTTVPPVSNTVPTYYRLINVGAQNVNFTYLTGYNHGCWSAFFADGINKNFNKERVKNDFVNVQTDDKGSVINAAELYVKNSNCTVEEESVFAWLAKQSRTSS